MRVLAILSSLLMQIAPIRAPLPVTVKQLEEFLTSPQAVKLSDAEIANRLAHVELAEQLTPSTFARIGSELEIGPKTFEQLEFLAAASMFQAPPADELPDVPKPSAATQDTISKAAHAYVNNELRLLPDFLAVRETRSFDNAPVRNQNKHGRMKVEMHFVREYRKEIAYRNGREVNVADPDQKGEPTGFSTWGEFGAILKIVLSDSFNGSVAWNRWQLSRSGARIAVFRYEIPRSSSHYTMDFCCYAKGQDSPAIYSFHDRPGYHGEIYIDPSTGGIHQITLEANLDEDGPITKSGIAVQYGIVKIDGKPYLCPVRSVAISELHNHAIEKIDGIGLERHLNEVKFFDYHKFGSTMRMITGAPGLR